MVERCVEYYLLLLSATLDSYLRELFVPALASFLAYLVKCLVGYLLLEVAFSTLSVYIRDTYLELYDLSLSCRELAEETYVLTLCLSYATQYLCLSYTL